MTFLGIFGFWERLLYFPPVPPSPLVIGVLEGSMEKPKGLCHDDSYDICACTRLWFIKP